MQKTETAIERYYYLSLGSNMGDRQGNLEATIVFLKGIGTLVKRSNFYETVPVGMAMETGLFYNMAVCLRSYFEPDALLRKIKGFEKQMGRDVTHSHNLPRIVDIDILMMEPINGSTFAGSSIFKTRDLEIPHPRMTEREFVLVPMVEIAPAVKHPVRHQTTVELLAQLPQPIQGIRQVSTVPA